MMISRGNLAVHGGLDACLGRGCGDVQRQHGCAAVGVGGQDHL